MAAILFATGLVAEAQVGKFLKKAKETVTSKVEEAVDNTVGSVVGEDAGNTSNSGLNVGGKSALSAVTNGKVYYVSLERGSARAEGTKDAPMRDGKASMSVLKAGGKTTSANATLSSTSHAYSLLLNREEQ